MPRKRVPVRKVTEVLRLEAEGRSIREIAQSVGLAKTTVSECLARARAAGIAWPLPPEVDAQVLEDRLYPRPPQALGEIPDWRQVHKELKSKHHVTRRLLWLEWKADHPESMGYSQFCYHYSAWLGLQDVVMRQEHRAGERLFVDFAGDTMDVIDPGTGEAARAQIFVATLGASGLIYAEATPDQKLASWIGAHTNAFGFYGGVTEVLVPDNLKTGVTRACWYDPEINPTYLDLARHYDTVVLPTRKASPRDKASVEVGVQVVERWVLAPLRHRRFFSLAELNQAVQQKLAEVNSRQFRGQPTSRNDLFYDLEQKALKPLPSTRYEFALFKPATVNIDYHVEFDHRFYSVPYQLVGQKVEIRASASVVEVLHHWRRVASHTREYGRARYITDPAHRPASHRAHLEWTPSRIITWASNIGPFAAQVTEKILATRPHPEHGYRACLGLIRLARRFGTERVEAACARAVGISACSYTSVKSILSQNLDRVPLESSGVCLVPTPPNHSNLRGADYYKEA